MSNLFTHKHTNRSSSTSGLVFTKALETVNIGFNTNPGLLGIFNYLGTKKLTQAYTNPLYSGVQFGAGAPNGIVRVGGSHSPSFSGSFNNVENLANKGADFSSSGVLFGVNLTFDFCSCTQSFPRVGIMNCLVSVSGVCLIGINNSGAFSVRLLGSNDGVNYTVIATGLTAPVNATAFAPTPASKFYRYIRVDLNGGNAIGEVELYGRIKFIR